MRYTEQLQNLDFKFANSFLSEETLSFGNKTVITSAFIILLCLNFISINSLEIEGINMTLRTEILCLVLFFINLYFFNQFNVALKVDRAVFKLPNDFTLFAKNLNTALVPIQENQELLTNKLLEIKAKAALSNSQAETDALWQEAHDIMNRINQQEELIKATNTALANDGDKAKYFKKTINQYNRLNSLMPQIAYYSSLVLIIVRLAIEIFIIYETKENPFSYFLNRELELVKVIMQSNHK